MKRLFTMAAVLLTAVTMMAKTETVPAPGNRLYLTFSDEGGVATYSVTYDDVDVLTASRLGFEADFGDFTKGLTMGQSKMQIRDGIVIGPGGRRRSQSGVRYTVPFTNAKGQEMKVIFNLTSNSIAYCYEIPRPGENQLPRRRLDLPLSADWPDDGLGAHKAQLRGGLQGRRPDGSEVAVRAGLYLPVSVPGARRFDKTTGRTECLDSRQ
jgi:hypothetical protein